MSERTVAMVVRNAVVHDARVLRCARAVAAAGYDVVVVGALRRGSVPEETAGAVRIIRVEPRSVALSVITALTVFLRRLDVLGKRAARRLRIARGAPRDLVVERTALTGVTERLRRVLEPIRLGLQAHAFQVVAGRTMAALRPVAYHCHDFNTVWAARIARRTHRAPFVYDAHEIYLHQNLPRFTRRRKTLVRLVEGFMIRRADAVVAANGSYADFLATTYGVARPTVVRNIPDDLPAPGAPHAFGDGGPVLLYVGGIVAGRGIPRVIEALPKIPEARLICIGPVVREEYQRSYEALARDLGVADRVRFDPPVPPNAVTAMAAGADVGVCLIEDVTLSYRLSLPNKLFECMHAGVPVVGSDFPEIGGLIERYGFGLTCDPSDPDAIAVAVRSILDDPARAEQMRARARAAAAENTWGAEATILADLYRTLVPA